MVSGPEFYDGPDIFSTYMRGRERRNNPNITLELPVTLELLGDITNKRILDLGCGDGEHDPHL